MYATTTLDFGLFSSTMKDNQWNPSVHSHHSSTHLRIARDEERLHEKFRFDTCVQLETGQKKNLQQITRQDLWSSIKQSPQYSG